MASISLAALARHIRQQTEVALEGDEDFLVHGIGTLQHAHANQLSFLSSSQYQSMLASTHAGALIMHPDQAHLYHGHKLLMQNPYLGYAIASEQFRHASVAKHIDVTAKVATSAQLGEDVTLGANVVIGANVVLADGVTVGANSVIEANTRIGQQGYIAANVSIYHNTVIGERAIVHSGAVIGADGFGFAKQGNDYIKIHQLGAVVIGDDVEIGANTCIDRGALDNTVIGHGVKLDNQIQIAHNVVLGDHTAMAGCSAVGGSSVVGKNCTIAGAAVVVGHLTVTDNVHVTAMSLVTHSINKPGVYSSGTGFDDNKQWRKNAVRFKQLDNMAKQIKRLEKQVQALADNK